MYGGLGNFHGLSHWPDSPMCSTFGFTFKCFAYNHRYLFIGNGSWATRFHFVVQSLKTVIKISPSPDRKSTRLNSSHVKISYAVFCLKKKGADKRRRSVSTM